VALVGHRRLIARAARRGCAAKDETISTLKFGTTCKAVKNRAGETARRSGAWCLLPLLMSGSATVAVAPRQLVARSIQCAFCALPSCTPFALSVLQHTLRPNLPV